MSLIPTDPFPAPLPTFSNPWQTKSSKEIYKNPWIRVKEDQVITPAGTPGIYSVIDTRIATAVVALDDNNNIYLVGQYRYPTNHYSWEVVEGGSEGSQGALETAKRELAEEAGLTADSWMQLGEEFHLSNCFSSEVAFAFLARGLSNVAASPDETEVLALIKIPFEETIQRVQSGEIRDALSIIALGRAKEFLGI
jgi:8-oxo-dGTP pyrophosphatase MutT (NUDIX family)